MDPMIPKLIQLTTVSRQSAISVMTKQRTPKPFTDFWDRPMNSLSEFSLQLFELYDYPLVDAAAKYRKFTLPGFIADACKSKKVKRFRISNR